MHAAGMLTLESYHTGPHVPVKVILPQLLNVSISLSGTKCLSFSLP